MTKKGAVPIFGTAPFKLPKFEKDYFSDFTSFTCLAVAFAALAVQHALAQTFVVEQQGFLAVAFKETFEALALFVQAAFSPFVQAFLVLKETLETFAPLVQALLDFSAAFSASRIIVEGEILTKPFSFAEYTTSVIDTFPDLAHTDFLKYDVLPDVEQVLEEIFSSTEASLAAAVAVQTFFSFSSLETDFASFLE